MHTNGIAARGAHAGVPSLIMQNAARLLLVDDDIGLCEAMTRAFTRRGFDVSTAHDTGSAWSNARERTPQYAVIDLKMPGDSGLTLIPRLKSLASEMCIVVLTGYASVATAVEAIKLGATHYLAKPVDVDQIVAAFGREAGDPCQPVADQPLSVERLEWEHIQRVLAEHAGNISATARSLNMHRRTLQRKLSKRPRPL
jgi:two-component system response regulator RegA